MTNAQMQYPSIFAPGGLLAYRVQSKPRSNGEGKPQRSGSAGKSGSGSEGDSNQTDYELPLDQIFELLKNSRRRETLRYLNEHDGNTTLSDLAEHIAALENDTSIRAITSAQRKRVYVGLYQCHLPKMDDTDVIEFDQNRGTIERGPNATQLEPYLDEPDDREWHKLYLGVAVGGGALLVAGRAGGAQAGLTPTVVLLLSLIGITCTATIHALANDRQSVDDRFDD